MSMPSQKAMQQAIAQRDKSFDGQFYYGVITTGVFCAPSCTSKPAKLENIRCFANIAAAIQAGFRPCKRCYPVGSSQQSQNMITIARYIEEHIEEKLTLAQLGVIAKLSSSRLQRAFKEVFSISPKQYQDALRIRHFKKSLKSGSTITDAIYSAGFTSSSRIYGEANRNIGMTPKTYRSGGQGEVIYYACRQTVLGNMLMAATDKGVCAVHFSDEEGRLITLLNSEFPNAKLVRSAAEYLPMLDNWIDALDKYLSQGTIKPEIPLDIKGTAFQIKVWQFLLTMKEGEVMSYGEVAAQIKQPTASRAVGTACGKNPIGVLIPCHRVLRANGSLGGYRWGLARKRALLDKERQSANR